MNLSSARSMTRATEVGIRKVLGANRSRLIKQFLTEALLLSAVAMIIAMVVALILLPVISDYAQRELSNNVLEISWLIPGLIICTIFVGLIAGSYPALILSRFEPVDVMKSKFNMPKANIYFRRFLVVTQFVISITLIIGTALVVQQLDFLKTKDAGFEKEHVVCISVRDETVRQAVPLLQDKYRQLPDVINSGAGSTLPGWSGPMNSKIPQGFTKDNTQLMRELNIDEGFIPTLEIEIIEGRNFSKEFGSDPRGSVIINETAARKFGWEKSLGKFIQTPNTDDPELLTYENRKVIGVVKDFHLSSLTREIQPFFIANVLDYPFEYAKIRVIATRIRPEDIQGAYLKNERNMGRAFSRQAI